MASQTINPYAIYVHCDGAMNYDSRSSSGIGVNIVFPDFVDIENIEYYSGSYIEANIERVELEALLQGMYEILKLYNYQRAKLNQVNIIIITTDRLGLIARTNPYAISAWRRNGWKNYEGKAIKNKDLLDKIDKTWAKVRKETMCRVEIEYIRRKYNKTADKLSQKAKGQLRSKRNINKPGVKIARKYFKGDFINYVHLEKGKSYPLRIYRKEPVEQQLEVTAEFMEGKHMHKKIKMYTSADMDDRLHRHYTYDIRIKKVHSNHIEIYKTIKERKLVPVE